ncbi:acireductone synthase [Yinghuangia seranimata]|uniref:acireductone synthase n=1 Tax=Yinghuangia seranimata TaxID=408067 RepID=UPI00248BBFA7|nr:acireductone synthase [Yinghuangia seranimata]MDI2126000.1 acireductone synthase [Yinghuangia seranimata]
MTVPHHSTAGHPLDVVVDIEGTTSATGFITEQLYPYSRKHFARIIEERGTEPDVARAVAAVRDHITATATDAATDTATGPAAGPAAEPATDTAAVVAALNAWLDRDEKATPLKTLQGAIWAEGFASGELTSHFYPDAIPALRAWHAAGHRLYVFSSGSVSAQLAWFGNSAEGSLLPLFSGHFDTENAGPKKTPGAYDAIAAEIGAAPSGIVFLSDLVDELDAAREAGWHTVGVRRPGEPYYDRGVGTHPETDSFARVDLTGDRPVVR